MTRHVPKVQSNATQQDCYPLITLCIPLLYMMSPVDTLREHQPLCLWHHTTENTLLNNSIIWHDVATTGYKSLCTCCSLTVEEAAVILYQTIPQYWCRKNKNATGKGGDYKCFGVGYAEGLLGGKLCAEMYSRCDISTKLYTV